MMTYPYRYGGGYIPKIKEWTDTLRNIRYKVNEKTGQYCNHAVKSFRTHHLRYGN